MANDQLSEQEIQFRKRARRRLIGAVALVLLMVTVLPMVLDEPDTKGPQPEIAISIPSQDGAEFSSKVVPAETQNHATAQIADVQEPTASPATAAAKVPVAPKPEPQLAAETSAAAANQAPVDLPPASQPIAASNEKDAAAKPVEKPSEKPATQVKDETKPADPKPAEVKPVQPKSVELKSADKPNVKKGTFSVQLGVLLATANIKPLQAKVKANGLPSYTENLDTPKGTMVRLRAGPFSTRAEAEQAHEKLKAAGLDGIIVTNK